MKCKICGKENKTINGLGTHITTIHPDTIKISYYFDFEYIEGNNGICKVCGKHTRFLDVMKGFKTFCSHQCANGYNNPTVVRNSILNRTEDRKYQIRKKQKDTWENKSTEEKDEHNKRIGRKIKAISKDISKKRVETMLLWSSDKKQEYINKLKITWTNMPKDRMKQKYERQKSTNIENGNWISNELLSDFWKYKKSVLVETKKHLQKLYTDWDGHDYYTGEKLIRTDEYKSLYPDMHPNRNLLQPTIDHITSICEGFTNDMDPMIIGGIDNLCVCGRLTNTKKRQGPANAIDKIHN